MNIIRQKNTENGANTSIDTLTKIANALGKRLTVNFS